MDVIELECPHCGDALELDAAFAGGVCRCSTCGTLMTVPADPTRDRAETLTRRDRPDSPGGTSGRPDTPGGARPERPDVPGARPDVPGGPPTRTTRDDSTGDLAALANAAPSESAPRQASTDTLYVTASGKAMDLSVGAVPTARKRRKVIRATVIGGFILCVLVLIGLIIFTANMLFSDKTPKIGPDPEYVGIDPSVNPITQPQINVLGIPVGRETAIVLDATSSSRVWYTQVAQIVAHTVAQSDTIDFMIIPWTDLTPKPFPGATPAKITRDKLGALDNALAQSPVGLTSPLEFVQLALTGKADQIILVTGRPLDADEFTALSEAIGKHVNTRFDAVVIDQHDPALQKLAKDNLGTYVSVKADQVNLWYEQWKKN